ncbi:hypothetical protein [Undibacterium terreum]|uniref:DUF1579 domain-containing protein n=1 Tax=Undibacterium terreum TaxID=1224302 RepID=A0A916U987_9BURK|nr:hypothetical protein [Undibacterium terreum]GGC62708.1 hypothetical protein GCM10011396_07090 [Undibacterium terreum]
MENSAKTPAIARAETGIHDFNFFYGHWHIRNRRLVARLQGCTEWEEFDAVGHVRPLPAGIGNYDDFIAKAWRPDFVGMSLRIFNPHTELWSIYWLENQTGGLNAAGALLPPVVGKFSDGVGIFEGDDMLGEKAVRVRYTWSGITATTARWEQAMSADGGLNWETNWIMEHVRNSGQDAAEEVATPARLEAVV